ncbi:hypothetical protein PR048_004485 [Dryococelus australis]|uniref:DDE Tnp4 domain-containing protein n=1 Tax=Dryococelus australis TaxID=614101 RepID=A0ABQ9I5K8_9NEOP|nr:hypothetical protein PR048_004485 [Dryococelus australis]
MNVYQFEMLVSLLKPCLLKRSCRKPLTLEQKLCMVLKYLAQGGSSQSLAREFCVGRSTMNKVIIEVCSALWNVSSTKYMSQPTEREWEGIVTDFWENPNGFYDANYTFKCVDVRDYGLKNDGSVFAASAFGQLLLTENVTCLPHRMLSGSNIYSPYTFVGDAALPLKSCIMKPCPGNNLCAAETIFNYRLSRSMKTVENAVGILGVRWQIYNQAIAGSARNCNEYCYGYNVFT